MPSVDRKDRIFARSGRILDFTFDSEVAKVFDDMLTRSVPLYHEILRMIGELANDFAKDKSKIYDLGCSNGNTLHAIMQAVKKRVEYVGVDFSEAMLAMARARFRSDRVRCRLVHHDLNNPMKISNASVVILNLTLQFLRPLNRNRLIQDVYQGLDDNGSIILIEKVLSADSVFNRLFIEHYHEFKERNGYSRTEIAKKRESLENVLVPFRPDENQKLLRTVGFKSVDVFFKWYNFCGIVGRKG